MRRIIKIGTTITILLLFSSWISLLLFSPKFSRSRRVIGGKDVVSNREYPFMVKIESGNRQCAGTLISRSFVLTAAHCVYDKSVEDIILKLGTNKFLIKMVDSKIIHPNYTETGLKIKEFDIYQVKVEYDVALLKLEQEFNYFTDSIQPIQLNDKNLQSLSFLKCEILGWGQTIPDDLSSHSEILQSLNIEIYQNCSIYGNLSKSEFCASSDACKGDSGGPLICDSIQVGIISWGVGCLNRDLPGVYARIDEFLSWIKLEMGDNLNGVLSSEGTEQFLNDSCETDEDCNSFNFGFYKFLSQVFQKKFASCERNQENYVLECKCGFTGGEFCENVTVLFLVISIICMGVIGILWFSIKKIYQTKEKVKMVESTKITKFMDSLNKKKYRRNSRKIKPYL